MMESEVYTLVILRARFDETRIARAMLRQQALRLDAADRAAARLQGCTPDSSHFHAALAALRCRRSR